MVSDAGMPCICDPGERIVNICHEKDISVFVVPGPCALISAISLSGLDCKRFTFYGFLSTSKKSRVAALNFLKDLEHPVILYEAPHKLLNTLKDLFEFFKDRKIVIVKEITKIYESVEIFTLSAAIKKYQEKKSIKGEFVLVLAPFKKKEETASLEEAVEFAKNLVLNGEKIGNAAKKAAARFNFKKNEIYKKISNFSIRK